MLDVGLNTYIRPWEAHPTTMSKRPSSYIHRHGRTHHLPSEKGTTLTSTIMVGHTIYHPGKGYALSSTGMVGHTIYHLGKGSALTSTGMVGHTIYHPRKGPSLRSISMVVHIIYHLRKGPALTSDHGRPNLPPC